MRRYYLLFFQMSGSYPAQRKASRSRPGTSSPQAGPSSASRAWRETTYTVASSSTSRPLNYTSAALASATAAPITSSGWGVPTAGWMPPSHPATGATAYVTGAGAYSTGASAYWDTSVAAPPATPGLLGPAPSYVPPTSTGLPPMSWPSPDVGSAHPPSAYVPAYPAAPGWDGYEPATAAPSEWAPSAYAASYPTSYPVMAESAAAQETVPVVRSPTMGVKPTTSLPQVHEDSSSQAVSVTRSQMAAVPDGAAVTTATTSSQASGTKVSNSGLTIMAVDTVVAEKEDAASLREDSSAEAEEEGNDGTSSTGVTARVTRSAGGAEEDIPLMLPTRLLQEPHTVQWKGLREELLHHVGHTYHGVAKQWLNKSATVIPVPASWPQDCSSRLLPMSSLEALQGHENLVTQVEEQVKATWAAFLREQIARERETLMRKAILDLRTLREKKQATAYHHLLYAHIWEQLGQEFSRVRARSDLMALSVGEMEYQRVLAFHEFLPPHQGILHVLQVHGQGKGTTECTNEELSCTVEKKNKKRRK